MIGSNTQVILSAQSVGNRVRCGGRLTLEGQRVAEEEAPALVGVAVQVDVEEQIAAAVQLRDQLRAEAEVMRA